MITPDLVVFKGLVQAAGKNEQFDFLQYTTESERTLLSSIEIGSFDPHNGLSSYKERLARIHYSWYVHLFSSIEHSDRAWLLAALPPETKEEVASLMQIERKTPSPFGEEYLSEMLYEVLTQEVPDLLPIECLPSDSLLSILDYDLPHLIELVDYLGLHDISPEIQTLINGKVLQKIQGAFSTKQKEYLKLLLSKKEPVIFSRLSLNTWDGDVNKLRTVLHQRGLNRLAKTVFGKSPSFLWHLMHRFDLGRARILKAYLNDLKNKQAHAILHNQVETLLNFMKTSSVT